MAKKKPKAAKPKPAKKKPAKVKLSAASKDTVVNIKASEQLGASYLAKIEKLAGMDVDIARISGERKNLMSDRAALARQLDEDAKELALVASGGHAELLFTEANISKDGAKLSQPAPKSPEGETVTAAASKTTTADELAAQDAFDAISLDALPAIKGAMKDKLLAEGIRTGKELRLWRNDRFAKKISGIGESALQVIDDAMADWFLKNPVKVSASVASDVRDSDAADLINAKGKLILQVAPRRNGDLCYGYLMILDKNTSYEQSWTGSYNPSESREQCTRDAIESVSAKIKEFEDGSLSIPGREVATEIRMHLLECGKLIKKPKKAVADSGESVNVAFVH